MDDVCRLIEAEIPRLRRYARALLRDKDRADDLVQDTIVRALQKIHLFERGTDLRAWLFTMMHNQHINSIRSAARRGPICTVEKVLLATPATQMAGLELRELERAIQRLPEEQRTTLLLVGMEGMSYEEVARVCDIPIGTVRSRVSRAREALRRMMEPMGASPAPPTNLVARHEQGTSAAWRHSKYEIDKLSKAPSAERPRRGRFQDGERRTVPAVPVVAK